MEKLKSRNSSLSEKINFQRRIIVFATECFFDAVIRELINALADVARDWKSRRYS